MVADPEDASVYVHSSRVSFAHQVPMSLLVHSAKTPLARPSFKEVTHMFKQRISDTTLFFARIMCIYILLLLKVFISYSVYILPWSICGYLFWYLLIREPR